MHWSKVDRIIVNCCKIIDEEDQEHLREIERIKVNGFSQDVFEITQRKFKNWDYVDYHQKRPSPADKHRINNNEVRSLSTAPWAISLQIRHSCAITLYLWLDSETTELYTIYDHIRDAFVLLGQCSLQHFELCITANALLEDFMGLDISAGPFNSDEQDEAFIDSGNVPGLSAMEHLRSIKTAVVEIRCTDTTRSDQIQAYASRLMQMWFQPRPTYGLTVPLRLLEMRTISLRSNGWKLLMQGIANNDPYSWLRSNNGLRQHRRRQSLTSIMCQLVWTTRPQHVRQNSSTPDSIYCIRLRSA